MSWMSGNVEMFTNTGGGLGHVPPCGRRRVAVHHRLHGRAGAGILVFATEFPGKIVDLHRKAGEQIILQKDAFMAAEKSVDLDIHLRKRLGAGFFGGEGFILERLTGPGDAFVELDGEIVVYDLQPGQVLKVDTGHVAMFEPTVQFDVSIIKGFRNILLGGEGLFLAKLSGPAKSGCKPCR